MIKAIKEFFKGFTEIDEVKVVDVEKLDEDGRYEITTEKNGVQTSTTVMTFSKEEVEEFRNA